MKRADTIGLIVVAAFHGDDHRATRLYVESRPPISRLAFAEALRKGREAKRNGARCSCLECTTTNPERSTP